MTHRLHAPSTADPACNDRLTWRGTAVLIVLAYCFAVGMRFTWIEYANGQASYQWNGHATPNNRDSFLFGCILQKACLGMHKENTMVPGVLHHGVITAVPYLLLKTTPVTIDQLLLYASVFVAPLIVVPLVWIGRLFGSTAWGGLAALVGGIGHSYYNRTLAGYFDTDMVSVTVPVVALACLMTASRKSSLEWSLAAAVTLFLYPF
ncbi:MAG: STT3 domain-containing protein, partial [Pirellulales bacterium]